MGCMLMNVIGGSKDTAKLRGTDEAGRGSLAGPVVAAAVILPESVSIPYLNDSKKLSARRRELLFAEIMAKAADVAWSSIDEAEIDRLNIYAASRLAMIQALAALRQPFDLVLSDAMPLPDLAVPCIPIVHGDALSASIAAASIIAKVTRDRIMLDMGPCCILSMDLAATRDMAQPNIWRQSKGWVRAVYTGEVLRR